MMEQTPNPLLLNQSFQIDLLPQGQVSSDPSYQRQLASLRTQLVSQYQVQLDRYEEKVRLNQTSKIRPEAL